MGYVGWAVFGASYVPRKQELVSHLFLFLKDSIHFSALVCRVYY